MKHMHFSVYFFLAVTLASAQSMVDVAESTLKVPALGEQIFYYGFAEGDQLIFNFMEVNGKELKELEIIELPSSSIFMDFKTTKVENKTFSIPRTGVYKFRFANSALGGRICKFKIQRVPGSSLTQQFNTNVYWRTRYDTTYTIAEERYLIKADTIFSTPHESTTLVSSRNALNGNPNKSIVEFVLPEQTVSWSFYIGVGSEGKQAYEAAKEKFVSSSAATLSKLPGYGSMAALALYGINTIAQVQGKDNVKYWFITDGDNANFFKAGATFYQYKQGDVINEASQMKSPVTGKVFIGLMNDNSVEPIEVLTKVTAVQVRQQWGVRTVNKPNVSATQVAYLKN